VYDVVGVEEERVVAMGLFARSHQIAQVARISENCYSVLFAYIRVKPRLEFVQFIIVRLVVRIREVKDHIRKWPKTEPKAIDPVLRIRERP